MAVIYQDISCLKKLTSRTKKKYIKKKKKIHVSQSKAAEQSKSNIKARNLVHL